jgi:hypothetical protein
VPGGRRPGDPRTSRSPTRTRSGRSTRALLQQGRNSPFAVAAHGARVRHHRRRQDLPRRAIVGRGAGERRRRTRNPVLLASAPPVRHRDFTSSTSTGLPAGGAAARQFVMVAPARDRRLAAPGRHDLPRPGRCRPSLLFQSSADDPRSPPRARVAVRPARPARPRLPARAAELAAGAGASPPFYGPLLGAGGALPRVLGGAPRPSCGSRPGAPAAASRWRPTTAAAVAGWSPACSIGWRGSPSAGARASRPADRTACSGRGGIAAASGVGRRSRRPLPGLRAGTRLGCTFPRPGVPLACQHGPSSTRGPELGRAVTPISRSR